jgi:hypothetical protein
LLKLNLGKVVFLKLLWYKKSSGGKIMSVKNLMITTILVLGISGCANTQTNTKIQAQVPKINICVEKGAAFGICPDGSPPEGALVWGSHKIEF